MTFLLNPPEQIAVETDEEGKPLRFTWRRRTHEVLHVADRWQADSEWWLKKRQWREHFKVTTDSGLLVTIYRDLDGEAWYVQCIYD